uniref:Uncharacterized protein n=1 Tax=Arundo donax TaxID=35708 RepID=A0A0A9TUD7_ARUDO
MFSDSESPTSPTRRPLAAASILGTMAPPQRVGAQESAAGGGRPLRRQFQAFRWKGQDGA